MVKCVRIQRKSIKGTQRNTVPVFDLVNYRKIVYKQRQLFVEPSLFVITVKIKLFDSLDFKEPFTAKIFGII